MANELAVIEKALDQAMPTIANILAATPGLPARSFKSALLSQMQNAKSARKIMECTMPSLMNCAATFAGLGLMPDGVSGQAYILPFKGTATPVIGYMGYNTLGDRAGRTIDGKMVREGDFLEYEYGTRAFVTHRPLRANKGRFTEAWATATALNRTPLVIVLDISELEEIRMKSPAVKGGFDSPWNDPIIGRPAMYEKSAKRRLKRGMPLCHYVVADAVETKFELTERPHYLLPGQDGSLQITDGVTGEQVRMAEVPTDDPIAAFKFRAQIDAVGKPPRQYENVIPWKMALLKVIDHYKTRPAALEALQQSNGAFLAEASNAGYSDEAMEVSAALAKAIKDAQP